MKTLNQKEFEQQNVFGLELPTMPMPSISSASPISIP